MIDCQVQLRLPGGSWMGRESRQIGAYLPLSVTCRTQRARLDIAISSSMGGGLGSATISQHWYESRPEHEWLVWPLSCHNICFNQALPWDTTPSGKHSSPFLPALIEYTILLHGERAKTVKFSSFFELRSIGCTDALLLIIPSECVCVRIFYVVQQVVTGLRDCWCK